MAVYIYDAVAVGRLFGEHFGLVAVEVDSSECALVGFGEECAVEIAFHNFGFAEEACFDDVVLLKFVLVADSIEAGVEFVCELDVFFVGRVALGSYFCHCSVERVDFGVEAADTGLCFAEACAQRCNLFRLIVDLGAERCDCLLQLVVVEVRFRKFLFEVFELVATLNESLLYSSNVGADSVSLAGSLSTTAYGENVFELFDLVHAR